LQGKEIWRAQKPSNFTFTEYTTLEEYVESVFGVQSTFLLSHRMQSFQEEQSSQNNQNK